MKIKVERCWNGHDSNHWRMTTPEGNREEIKSEKWDRDTARRALDIFEKVYKYNRNNIRFEVR